VPEHCTLLSVLVLLFDVVVCVFSVVKNDEIEGWAVPTDGLQTLQAVKPSALACATVVSIELFRYLQACS
jgi:hypothetical protein